VTIEAEVLRARIIHNQGDFGFKTARTGFRDRVADFHAGTCPFCACHCWRSVTNLHSGQIPERSQSCVRVSYPWLQIVDHCSVNDAEGNRPEAAESRRNDTFLETGALEKRFCDEWIFFGFKWLMGGDNPDLFSPVTERGKLDGAQVWPKLSRKLSILPRLSLVSQPLEAGRPVRF
jgi:hypothetical protein